MSLKERVKVRWKLRRVRNRLLRLLENEQLTPEQSDAVAQEATAFYDPLNRRLSYLLTEKLKDQAQRWGVEVPSVSDQPEWWAGPEKGLRYLNHHGLARVQRLVRNARRAEIKWWAELLVPILALIVAILSLTRGSH
jgi:hypothetical protein